MLIKKSSQIQQIQGMEGTKIKEYFYPKDVANTISYSLAQFTLEPNKRTKLHKLNSTEIYYILEGNATVKINGEAHNLTKDDSILILADSEQYIENTGSNNLRFLCIVEPSWEKSNETLLE